MAVRGAFAVALLAALAAPAEPPIRGSGGRWEREVKGTISTAGAERLKLLSPGRLTVRPATGRENVIAYTWVSRIRAANEAAAREQFAQSRVHSSLGNGWCVVTVHAGSTLIQSDLSVVVPAGLRQYAFELAGGSLSVRGLNGDVVAATGAGAVDMDEIRGSVAARTGGGAMTFGRIDGALRCLSGGGSIRVTRAGGEAVLESAGGEIWLQEAGAGVRVSTAGNIHIGRSGGAVAAHTAGGLIEVDSAEGVVTAETAGGPIVIGRAQGVRAESANGGIRMNQVTGVIRASTASGNIFLGLGADRALGNSFLSSGRGDITVTVPPKAALTVKALNESGSWYSRIVSDFPEVRAHAQSGMGPRRAVLAEGAINGGGPSLMLSVSNGAVYLKRAK